MHSVPCFFWGAPNHKALIISGQYNIPGDAFIIWKMNEKSGQMY